MNNWEIVREANEKMESSDPSRAAQYFTEDFAYEGTLVRPMDKEKFIEMAVALKKAFPDLSFNLKLVQEIPPDRVRATLAPVGTHTGIFAIPGLPPVAATGKTIAQPRQLVEYTLRGGQICQARMEHASEGGLKGLLEVLGLEPPDETMGTLFP